MEQRKESTNHNQVLKKKKKVSQSATQKHRQRGGCKDGKAVRTLEHGGESRGWAVDCCKNEEIALFYKDF